MIKAVIFDLGGVLFTNGTKQFIQDISAKYHLDPIEVKEVMDGDIGSRYREGKMTRDAFWETCLKKFSIPQDKADLEAQWINEYELIEGTKDILFALKKKGIQVLYLSDNVKERVDKINEKYNFIGWFDDGIFSHEVGVRKPNPRIYAYALDKVHAKPNETLFIDDKQSALEPAKAMGMVTILFETPERLRVELTKRRVLS